MWFNAPARTLWRISGVRVALGGVAMALFGALLVFAIIHHAAETSWRAQIDDRISDAQTDLLGDIARNHKGLAWNVQATLAEGGGLFYAVMTPDGEILAGNFRLSPAMAAHWTGERTMKRAQGLTLPPHVLALRGRMLNFPDGERLFIAADASALLTLNNLIARSFLAVFGTILALGLVISLLVGRMTLRRVDQFASTLHEIMAGDLSRRIEHRKRPDEFDRLAIEVNRTLERIHELMENLRQVTNDISHDLRTPLARLREHLELARAGFEDERFREMFDTAITELDQALAIFSALLRLAEIEAGARRAQFRTLDLTGILQALVESYEPAMADRGIKLTAEIEAGLALRGDKDLLNQAIANLLDNILVHPESATKSTLRASHRNGKIHLSISDNGEGIPASQRDRVMQRFVRLDAARHKSGHGLGLPMVNAIITLHGGAMSLQSGDKGGLVVGIVFLENL